MVEKGKGKGKEKEKGEGKEKGRKISVSSLSLLLYDQNLYFILMVLRIDLYSYDIIVSLLVRH
jgi:hypothetical protein